MNHPLFHAGVPISSRILLVVYVKKFSLVVLQVFSEKLKDYTKYLLHHCRTRNTCKVTAKHKIFAASLQNTKYLLSHCRTQNIWWVIAERKIFAESLQNFK